MLKKLYWIQMAFYFSFDNAKELHSYITKNYSDLEYQISWDNHIFKTNQLYDFLISDWWKRLDIYSTRHPWNLLNWDAYNIIEDFIKRFKDFIKEFLPNWTVYKIWLVLKYIEKAENDSFISRSFSETSNKEISLGWFDIKYVNISSYDMWNIGISTINEDWMITNRNDKNIKVSIEDNIFSSSSFFLSLKEDSSKIEAIIDNLNIL